MLIHNPGFKGVWVSIRKELRVIGLFRAEGFGGVDGGGSMRGDEAGEEGGGAEQKGNGGEGSRVPEFDSEEQAAEEGCGGEGAEEADDDATTGEAGGFAEDEAVDGGTGGSEGHAHADLAGAAADGVGDDAVETDHPQEESHGGESTHEPGGDTVEIGGRRVVDVVDHGRFLKRGEAGIDLVDGLAERGKEGVGILCGAGDGVEVAIGGLEVGDVEDGAGRHVEGAFLDVVDNADDLDGLLLVAPDDSLSDGFVAGEEAGGEELVDDGDAGPGGVLGVAEEAAFDETGTEGGEVVGADLSGIDLVWFVVGATEDADAAEAVSFADGEIVRDGDGLDAGESGEAVDDLALEDDGLLVLAIACGGTGDVEHGEVFRLEAGVDAEEADGALDKEAGSDEEDGGGAELEDDEVGSEAAPEGAGGTPALFPETLGAGQGKPDDRGEGEDFARQEDDDGGKGGDVEVETDVGEVGHGLEAVCRDELEEGVHRGIREDEAGDAAGKDEQEAFGDELADEPVAGGSESSPKVGDWSTLRSRPNFAHDAATEASALSTR